MKNYLLFAFIGFIPFFSVAQRYPETKKTSKTFTKHNISYQDDYTWLENMRSPEVNQWVDAENAFTESNAELIRTKYSSASKIKEYDFLSTNGLPTRKGKYFFSQYRVDKSKPAVLFYRKGLNDYPVEVVDPYKIYKDENVYLSGYSVSKNSVYLALKINTNGSDKQEIRFTDIDKKQVLPDILKDVKFSNMAWNGDRGIFYKKNANVNAFAQDSTFQLFYHKIGKPQAEDELVFDATKNESSLSFFTARNKLFIIETSKDETSRNYYCTDIGTETFMLEKIIDNDQSGFRLLSFYNNRMYFSSKDYDWGEVRACDLKDRTKETVIVPQIYTHLLVDTEFLEDYIICKYKQPGKYYLSVYDYNGNFIRKFDAPYGMNFNFRFYDKETKELFVTFYSYTMSFHNFRLNVETGESRPYYNDFIKPKSTLFPLDYFENKTITYKSRDNKDVPITLIYKKGLKLDGTNPTLLKAYGGFGSISGPSFDTGLLYFLEKCGVFAFAEIRGGGEKGLKWHNEGKGLKKMNSFHDFIDAAEFLIREKYTSPDKLAITGGSNGGLVVGVAMTQRPELFKVAIPEVGVFDMARFDEYSVGKYHLDEYGNPENEMDYKSLLAFSPYYNIKENVNYPTTLIVTSENDDRVPPVHSYKFAARLQNRSAQKNPIFLKINRNSGHYGKISNYKSRTDESAEFYNFLLYYLNN